MLKVFLIFSGLIFGFLNQPEINAQSLLKNGKIPKDFLIVYTNYHRYCNDELKIGADRKMRLNLLSCLLEPQDFARYEAGKTRKSVPKEKLRELIAEFEKIDFFNLKAQYIHTTNNQYANPMENCTLFLTDTGTSKIFIRINGREKEILFENGCLNKPETPIEKLKKLSEKIRLIRDEARVEITKIAPSQPKSNR